MQSILRPRVCYKQINHTYLRVISMSARVRKDRSNIFSEISKSQAQAFAHRPARQHAKKRSNREEFNFSLIDQHNIKKPF